MVVQRGGDDEAQPGGRYDVAAIEDIAVREMMTPATRISRARPLEHGWRDPAKSPDKPEGNRVRQKVEESQGRRVRRRPK